MGFDARLAEGRTGESVIARWVRTRGWCALPVYEKIIDEGKGPQIFTPGAPLIAPDMLVFRQAEAFWIEAKHKTAFSWHRATDRWVTGIDLRHYGDYMQVDDASPWPVWLFFLHRGGQAKDSSAESPAGLFANKLAFLRLNENHRSQNWGRSGMVYWAQDNLKKMASIDEIALLDEAA